MEEQKESVLNNYPNIISYDCLKKIIEQMERNICKVNIYNILNLYIEMI